MLIMGAKTEQYFRKTLDVKTSGISLIEGLGFGGLIVATDYVDEQMKLDQTTLKSISNTLPIILSLASTIGVLFTKGGAQSGMRDVQLMSTPFAAISIVRILRTRGIFGRLFKKKRVI